MITYVSSKQLKIVEFQTPFEQHLNPENKWVKLANAMPWDEFVGIYSRNMSKQMGRPSISPRLAVSALIIKHMEDLDDRGVVAALEENVYMQYFAGYTSFSTKTPFDHSLMVEMRLRMGNGAFDEMTLLIIKKALPIIESIKAEKKKSKRKKQSGNSDKNKSDKNDTSDGYETEGSPVDFSQHIQADSTEVESQDISNNIDEDISENTPENTSENINRNIDEPGNITTVELADIQDIGDPAHLDSNAQTVVESEPAPNKGNLILDATIADQMIKFPTDAGLLNQARLETERIIDLLYRHSNLAEKPRTYRVTAQKEYLALAKKKNKSKQQIRKIISKQLGYLRRNIHIINTLLDITGVTPLRFRDLKLFWVIQHLHDQQRHMYVHKTNSHPDRIVSIYQPYVRPMPRGKDKHHTEFGAKLGVSLIDGFSIIDHFSWDAYSESGDLVLQVEKYKSRFGYYPECVMADGAYMSRTNREYLKEKNIRHIGKSLGRPRQLSKAEKLKLKQDRGIRNEVEGKFGQGKNAFGLSEIRARRSDTSMAWISGIWFAMNITRFLKIMPMVGLVIQTLANLAFFGEISAVLRSYKGLLRRRGGQFRLWEGIGQLTSPMLGHMKPLAMPG